MEEKNEEPKEQLTLDLKTAARPAPEEKIMESGDGAILEWICHPAKKNPKITVIVTLFLFVLVVMVYYMTYSVWFAILAVLILFGSLASFYFPTRYKLTTDEIIVITKMQALHKKWSQYRSVYPDKNGVLLSPFIKPSRLENFRGLYLRFWYNRDEVMAFVKERMSKEKTENGKES